MDPPRDLGVARGNGDDRAQNDLPESSRAVRGRDEHPFGGVVVALHDDPVGDRDVEVTQQVALGERRDEHLFGVPAIDIAVEHAGG